MDKSILKMPIVWIFWLLCAVIGWNLDLFGGVRNDNAAAVPIVQTFQLAGTSSGFVVLDEQSGKAYIYAGGPGATLTGVRNIKEDIEKHGRD